MLSEEAIDLNNVIISKHALEQYVRRFKKLHPQIKDVHYPEEKIKKLLSFAVPENIGKKYHLKRLMKHKAKATYLEASGWRLILEDGIIVTIERRKPEEN